MGEKNSKNWFNIIKIFNTRNEKGNLKYTCSINAIGCKKKIVGHTVSGKMYCENQRCQDIAVYGFDSKFRHDND